MTNLGDLKKCTKCNKEKSFASFNKCKRYGREHRCKECKKENGRMNNRLRSDKRPDNIIPDLEGEIWVDAIYNEGKYKVSSLGRIKSMDRLVNGVDGVSRRRLSSILKPRIDICGYARVGMYPYVLVHNIVFYSFNKEIKKQKGFVVDHKDENKFNNRLANLQFITHTANVEKNYDIKRNKTSKYRGIHFSKDRNKWVASSRIDGIQKFIGYFEAEMDAVKAHSYFMEKATSKSGAR